MTSTLRRAPAAFAALALAFGLAACSLNGGGSPPPSATDAPTSAAPESTAPESAAPAGSPAAGGDGCPTSAPEPLPAGETREVTIETDLGNVVIDVEADLGPLAAGNFVIQGGDPTGTGSGGPGYEFPNDPVSVPYERGVVAMANAGRDTNGSQFFIVLQEAGLPPDYSVFGRVTSGMEVADEIAAGPKTGPQGDLAAEPVTMNRVTVANP
jgi:cyclophilin family peptidyl-prolyl cis-trans isomerase/predicted small lipoprotein YifL